MAYALTLTANYAVYTFNSMLPTDIAAVRCACGLTQAALGQTLNVHVLTVSKWARGALVPDARDVAILVGLTKLDYAAAKAVGEAVKTALATEGSLAAYRLLLDAAIPKGAV